MLTVRTTPSRLERIRELLRQHDGSGTSCPGGPPSQAPERMARRTPRGEDQRLAPGLAAVGAASAPPAGPFAAVWRPRRVPFTLLLGLLLAAAACRPVLRAPRLTGARESPAIHGTLTLPATPGPRPAVILLPGSAGWRPEYDRLARPFADSGLVALTLDYYADAGRGLTRAQEQRNWPAWQATIRNAVTWLRANPAVAGQPVALVGYSRGAMLAISIGDTALPVAAIVDLYGAGSDDDPPTAHLAAFPPLLILHGDADSNLPVALAHRLHERLRANGADVEIHIYPGAGHGFDMPWSPAYSPEAAADAWRRTIAFLRQRLPA